ncbi:spore coat associated protein CotJA [Clostridium sp. BJN0001]|uniref:spore coat associated protein CotJA n=1 Tax=Clostridium sp. BJN0001 TaxID=2930219 RepID=UPI001FD35842|nr:spore coat associated protein CotJA [Clostridium sp. BJN0001]
MNENDKCIYDKDYDKYDKKEYARVYIKPQQYTNLFTCTESFANGTIFKDLAKIKYKC